MGKAMALWRDGKTDDASAVFERIALAEPTQWLPNYYVGLISTLKAFEEKDKSRLQVLLSKAQQAVDVEMAKDPTNAELMVLQALVYTAHIVSDPMTNGMVYSGKAMEQYAKAQVIAPQNPRVVLGKAEFEMGSARYFGKDTSVMCAEIERAIGLFAAEKPLPFHPNWGADRAKELKQSCK